MHEQLHIVSARSRRHALPRRQGGRVPFRRLAAASDERLVSELRRGDARAFEAIYDRHSVPLLGFCRHMLGSAEEAEDALQQVFVSAHLHLRDGGRIELKPWLYAIARNRCLSMLRARRETFSLETAQEPSTDGLVVTEAVERREDVEELLDDLARLPDDQRAALLLAEVGDLSQQQIAAALGVRHERVKALIFQARTRLGGWREARATDCAEIQAELATLRSTALRRGPIRRHLMLCEGCAAFALTVGRQRAALGAVLPVVPTAALKHYVLSATLPAAQGTAAAGAVAVGSSLAASGAAIPGAAGIGAAASGLAAKALVATAVIAGAGGAAAVRTHDPPPAQSTAAQVDRVGAAGAARFQPLRHDDAGAAATRTGAQPRRPAPEPVRPRAAAPGVEAPAAAKAARAHGEAASAARAHGEAASAARAHGEAASAARATPVQTHGAAARQALPPPAKHVHEAADKQAPPAAKPPQGAAAKKPLPPAAKPAHGAAAKKPLPPAAKPPQGAAAKKALPPAAKPPAPATKKQPAPAAQQPAAAKKPSPSAATEPVAQGPKQSSASAAQSPPPAADATAPPAAAQAAPPPEHVPPGRQKASEAGGKTPPAPPAAG